MFWGRNFEVTETKILQLPSFCFSSLGQLETNVERTLEAMATSWNSKERSNLNPLNLGEGLNVQKWSSKCLIWRHTKQKWRWKFICFTSLNKKDEFLDIIVWHKMNQMIDLKNNFLVRTRIVWTWLLDHNNEVELDTLPWEAHF